MPFQFDMMPMFLKTIWENNFPFFSEWNVHHLIDLSCSWYQATFHKQFFSLSLSLTLCLSVYLYFILLAILYRYIYIIASLITVQRSISNRREIQFSSFRFPLLPFVAIITIKQWNGDREKKEQKTTMNGIESIKNCHRTLLFHSKFHPTTLYQFVNRTQTIFAWFYFSTDLLCSLKKSSYTNRVKKNIYIYEKTYTHTLKDTRVREWLSHYINESIKAKLVD